jgi:hypothetical protein
VRCRVADGQAIGNNRGVSTSGPIVVLAFAPSAGSLLAFGTLVIVVMVWVAFMLTRGSGSAYDQIGAGGLVRDGEHAGAGPAPAPGSAAALLEREHEIRQMLRARSERLVRAGQPALDVEAELARLLTSEPGGRAASTHDAELLAEVRQLVRARNERRVRQGLEPLDVEAEVARTVAELGA